MNKRVNPKQRNLAPLFCSITLLFFAVATVTIVPPVPLWWDVLSWAAFVCSIICSIVTIVFGLIGIIKHRGTLFQNVVCILSIVLLWLIIFALLFLPYLWPQSWVVVSDSGPVSGTRSYEFLSNFPDPGSSPG